MSQAPDKSLLQIPSIDEGNTNKILHGYFNTTCESVKNLLFRIKTLNVQVANLEAHEKAETLPQAINSVKSSNFIISEDMAHDKEVIDLNKEIQKEENALKKSYQLMKRK